MRCRRCRSDKCRVSWLERPSFAYVVVDADEKTRHVVVVAVVVFVTASTAGENREASRALLLPKMRKMIDGARSLNRDAFLDAFNLQPNHYLPSTLSSFF